MKKLLALSLVAVMVLGFAAVSMAATVTVGGELGLQFTSTATKTLTTLKDIDSSNIHVDAVLNDDVSVHIQYDIFNGNDGLTIDDSYFKVANFGVGTLQVGKTGWGTSGMTINMSNAGGQDDYGYGLDYKVALTDEFSATIGYATHQDGVTTTDGHVDDTAVALNYTQDGSGANLYYNLTDSRYDFLATLKLDDNFTFRGLYGQNAFGAGWALASQWAAELNYVNGPFGAIVEYDNYAAANTAHPTTAEYVQLSYTFANNFGTLLRWCNDTTDHSSITKGLLRVSF